MTYKIRRWLYRFFIFLFVILTTYISLYATGYQFNFRGDFKLSRLLVKTGTLVINSQPAGATIYINDHLQTDFSLQKFNSQILNTPAKIKNLAPGEYDVRLEKPGYWAWDKKINILAEQTTYAEDINLFKKDSLLNILSCSCQAIELSPNRRYLLLTQGAKIIDLKTNQEITLNLPKNIQAVQWLISSNQVLINSVLFDLNSGATSDYQKIIGQGISQLYYSESDNRLYYRNRDSLNYFDLKKNISEAVFQGENFSAYYLKGNHVFYLSQVNAKVILKSLNLNDRSLISTELPPTGDYEFLPDVVKWLNIYNRREKIYYSLDPATLKPIREALNGYRGGVWLQEDKLLYYTDFEIYLFDLKQNNKILINRIGEEISGLVWQAKNNYIIYATKSTLNTLDFGNNNIVQLLKANNISSIFLDAKTDTLYFTAAINKEPGLYKMVVQ